MEDYPGPKVEIVEVFDWRAPLYGVIGQPSKIGTFRAAIGEGGKGHASSVFIRKLMHSYICANSDEPISLQNRFKKSAVVSNTIPFSGPRMMSPEKAAECIAVSVDLIYEMIKAQKIPVVLKGNGKRKLYTVDRCDLDTWLERNKTVAAA